jgi:lipopolysaccharide transport system permease protein
MLRLSDFLWPTTHATLIWQFARREVLGKYRGSMLGLGWSLLTPLAMLAVYTLVFRHIFKARWPGMDEGNLTFALNLFAGLIVFNWAAEFINRAPRLIVSQPNLVTKVVFPLQVLCWSALLASLFHALLATVVWLAISLLVGHGVGLAWLALPLIFLALLPVLLGLGWLLSSLGVFFRDLAELTGPVMGMLLFLTPVFFPGSALPQALQPWLPLNPLSTPIEALRAVVLLGVWPNWAHLGWLFVAGVGLSLAGIWVFTRTRGGFADVI